MVQATVALRVDVDTRRGLEEGVPRLLDLFRRAGTRASFFVTMGPDRSGLAVRRALRPGFLAKMWRTNALRLYGVRTLLSGTLLPARPVGAGLPALLRQIAAEGHEVGPHGWDHVRWQDRVHRLARGAIRAELARAAAAFESALGVRPGASAAPGWRTSPEALLIQEELGLRYASDARGTAVFRPAVGGRALATLQVPTTLPTLDELLGRVRDLPGTLLAALRPGLNVFTLHAEVEGGLLLGTLAGFLDGARRAGAGLATLDEVVARITAAGDDVPVAAVTRGRVEGRSGWVASQGLAWAPA
jgi:peptidoglycan/xylan/chitin deacetylase (PgdA/CDA1 family)